MLPAVHESDRVVKLRCVRLVRPIKLPRRRLVTFSTSPVPVIENSEDIDAFPRKSGDLRAIDMATCDPLALNESDLNANRTAFQLRNLEACKRGLPACDPSQLNGPEMASVTAAFRERRSRLERNRPATKP